MEKIIIATLNELTNLIEDSLKKVLLQTDSQKSSESQLPELLNISQAAGYLNLAKQTIYGFTSKGGMPFIKRGKKLYFKKTELDKWLNEGVVKAS